MSFPSVAMDLHGCCVELSTCWRVLEVSNSSLQMLLKTATPGEKRNLSLQRETPSKNSRAIFGELLVKQQVTKKKKKNESTRTVRDTSTRNTACGGEYRKFLAPPSKRLGRKVSSSSDSDTDTDMPSQTLPLARQHITGWS